MTVNSTDHQQTPPAAQDSTRCEPSERGKYQPPKEAASSDPEVLRAALIREAGDRRRAECRANIQTEVVRLAFDLLVREPDIEGFFGALAKTMVEESESHTCAVWLLDDSQQAVQTLDGVRRGQTVHAAEGRAPVDCRGRFAAESRSSRAMHMARHLFAYTPGWHETIEYRMDDPRLPEPVRAFSRENGLDETFATPLLLGDRILGWMTVCSGRLSPEPENRWWRVILIEAIARQAALALHHNNVVEHNRREERRKGILEERNRIARDIHDNLAQGFAAILMQLQGAQRDRAKLPVPIAVSVDTAVELARTHLTEARRSVSALRPDVGGGDDMATSLKRLADMGQRTNGVPVELVMDDLPRFGDGVEREILAIAQEALTNAVRHAHARRIMIRASSVQSVGLRLSVADDGRGMTQERSASGFGLTSMQERADRIGASLTIVTAPRHGTEVVLAWTPVSQPAELHVAG